ncbi:GNAT family N-acetyltransferase [Bacillus sp. es.036]|uniref:GNAT family N-acetyltransferase n=1 Tax=Bacillus sp. es.036 TaxID=1761764 RepID=UPI000BF90A1F|nr:GNAT family protein [Bacillus sp. es.036]PFG15096.1 ribosomal-protein-alanine N-acetyltransferase [Bacillus sp. es.036]
MEISIRKFQRKDIPYKVKWINDEKNNKYLHYELPLREEKTLLWYESLVNRNDRVDFTITYNGEPAGLIGLLNIDNKNKKAEYYICLGSENFKGKGIAKVATDLLIKFGDEEIGLNKIYLYTEVENIQAQKLFESCSFEKEGLLKNDLVHNEEKIDRYIYGLNVENYIQNIGAVNESR